MSQMFNKTITLLNRFQQDGFDDAYYITKISNVCAQIHVASNNNATNSSDSSRCSLFINNSALPKSWLPPKLWIASEQKSLNLTFKDDDYIVVGDITEQSVTDIDSLYDKYDYVFKIYSYAYFELLKSFQIKAL
jgi:hypothetical protein